MRRDTEVVAQSRREEKPSPALLIRINSGTRHLRSPTPAVTDFDPDDRVVSDDPQTELPPRKGAVQHSVRGKFGNAEPDVVLPDRYAPLVEGLDSEGTRGTHRSAVAGESSLP